MIRINLLGVERQKLKKAAAFDVAQRLRLTVACSLIVVGTAAGIGWWFWSLRQESARLDTELVNARQRQAQLASVLTQVREFEARRTQLQQRVTLIEELRAGQSMPVQILDHVSKSLPDTLWLTLMDQTPEGINIEGRSTTVPALTSFVTNLATSPLIQKPVDFEVKQETSTSGPGQQAAVELIRFTVRAKFAKDPAADATAAGSTAATPGAAATTGTR
jgi:type IV pilus assembly protein PilN